MKHTVKDNVLTIEIPLVTEDQYPWRDNESIGSYEQRLKDIANISVEMIIRNIETLVENTINSKDSKP